MYEKPQFEIPETVRELAERNVEQARSAYTSSWTWRARRRTWCRSLRAR